MAPPSSSAAKHWCVVRLSVRVAVAQYLKRRAALAKACGLDGHGSYLLKLQAGVNIRSHLGTEFDQARIGQEMKLSASLASAGAVVCEVSSEAEVEAIPIWQQGDASLSTADAMRERLHLKRTQAVRAALHEWWALVGVVGDFCCTDEQDELVLTCRGHQAVYLRIFKILLEEFDANEAAACVAEDWEHDAGSLQGLGQEAFFDSLFECALSTQPAHLGSSHSLT